MFKITNREKFEIAILAKQPNSNKSQIAREYDIPRNNIKSYLNYFTKEYKNNKCLRHQILLGSKLGDGYFQKTSNGTYKYRESHSLDELEYAAWKYLMLGDMTESTSIISKNNGRAVEIFTSANASKEIRKYTEMNFNDVMREINIYGLIVYLLDDGWYSNHSQKGNFLIGSRKLNLSQKKPNYTTF